MGELIKYFHVNSRTAVKILFKAQWLLHVQPILTMRNSVLCPDSEVMYFLFFSNVI
jgi:hypothetical protein